MFGVLIAERETRVSRNYGRLIFTTMSFQPRPFAPVRVPDNFTIPQAARECYRVYSAWLYNTSRSLWPAVRALRTTPSTTARRFSTHASHDLDNVPFQPTGVSEDRGNLDVYVRL